VQVWYEAKRNNQPIGTSQRLELHVGAAAQLPWPLPKLRDATNSEVSTWQPVKPGTLYDSNTATLVITDSRIQRHDTVAVAWQLPDQTDLTIPRLDNDTVGVARVAIPEDVLARSLGKTVRVAYAVFRAGQTVGSSAATYFQIGTVPASALSQLLIVEAANGGAGPELHVNSLTGNATVRVGRWPLIAQRQSVWLTLSGTRQDGSPYNKQLIGPPSVVDAGWVSVGSKTFTVSVTELKDLRDASSLTLTLKVGVAGGTSEAAAVVFAPKIYTVRSTHITLAPPEVLEAPSGTLDFATVYTARYITVRARISTNALEVDAQAAYTVMVRWVHEGLVYHSEIVQTTLPRTLIFEIPRLEVIDVIRAHADINYTVYGNGVRLSSDVLRLYVTGQDIEVPAPRFNAASREVTVLYPAQLDGHRVTARWTGVNTHETTEQPVQTGVVKHFPIPALWLTENAGKVVLINYNVLRRSGELKLFSRLLRLQL